MAKEDDNMEQKKEQQREDAITTDSASPPDNEGPPESSKRNENESNESAAAEAKKKQKREHNKLKANAHGAHDVDDDKTLELMREKARLEGRTAVGSYRPRSIPKRTRLQGAQQGSSSSGPGTTADGGCPAAYSIEGLAAGSHAAHQYAGQTTAPSWHAPHLGQPPIYNIISQYWYGNFDDEDTADPAEYHVMPTNGADDGAPPLTHSEAHTRHKEMSDILVFVAGLKDKEAEQNISIAQDVDLVGWVKSRAAHVENTLQRFGGARATTHVYRQLEATAKQAREALRGLGVAGLPDYSSGGGDGGFGGARGSGGGGAGTSSAGGDTARE